MDERHRQMGKGSKGLGIPETLDSILWRISRGRNERQEWPPLTKEGGAASQRGTAMKETMSCSRRGISKNAKCVESIRRIRHKPDQGPILALEPDGAG